MRKALVTYVAVLAGILVLDAIWLGAVAKRFYANRLGYLMAPDVRWWAAALFYLLFASGVLYFVVLPLAATGSPGRAFVTGALFGLVAYGTYDLTSQAIVRGWPVVVTAIDLAWGALLTGTVSVIGLWSARLFK
jgi:uncharacterized membrane protein